MDAETLISHYKEGERDFKGVHLRTGSLMEAEIPGLYLAGANTQFGHGIAGAMVGGIAASSAVIEAAS